MGIMLYIIHEQVLFSIGVDATKFLNSGLLNFAHIKIRLWDKNVA